VRSTPEVEEKRRKKEGKTERERERERENMLVAKGKKNLKSANEVIVSD